MPEKPIVMSAWSVLAMLEHRKWQTRRPVKPQPPEGAEVIGYSDEGEGLYVQDKKFGLRIIAKPQYKVGDELWVKEALKVCHGDSQACTSDAAQYAADDKLCWKAVLDPLRPGHDMLVEIPWRWPNDKLKNWYMPRDAARIFPVVTRVRCEYVQDITVEDAIAEGCLPQPFVTPQNDDPILNFRCLWNSIYTKPPYRWQDHPLTFGYDFAEETCDKP